MKKSENRIKSTKRRKLDPEDKRARILSAAHALFAAGEYEAVPVSAIVRKAGVAQGTFYRYFPSKSDVLDGLTTQVDAAVSQAVLQIFNNALQDNSLLQDVFVAAMESALRAIEPYRNLLHVIDTEALSFGSSKAGIARRKPYLETLHTLLTARQETGEVGKDLALTPAILCIDLLLNGVARKVLFNTSDSEGKAIVMQAAQLLAKGLSV